MSEKTPRSSRAIAEEPNREQVEKNIGENLELRLLYAEAVAAKAEVPVSDVLFRETDTHARIFGYIPERSGDNAHAAWLALQQEIDTTPSHDERVEILRRYFKEYAKEHTDHRDDPFWPFRYDEPGDDGVVKLHFGSMSLTDTQSPDEPSILSSERLHEQRAKLKAMFAEIKQKHPHARLVRGASWLYNREAYRRLYPASYTAHAVPRKTREFVGAGRGVSSVEKMEASTLRHVKSLNVD